MHVVIDIPEEQYKYLAKIADVGQEPLGYFERVIMNGTPLTKGHGPLKDIDWIDEHCDIHHSDIDGSWCYTLGDLEDAPTIVEADKEG